MKFQKVIAEALARKTQKIINENRNEFINNYKLSKDETKALTQLYNKFEEIRKQKEELVKKYNELIGGFRNWIFEDKTKEEFIDYVRKIEAEKECPSISESTLVDDFLILSIDAIDTEDLINKVTAKYVK